MEKVEGPAGAGEEFMMESLAKQKVAGMLEGALSRRTAFAGDAVRF